MEITGKTSIMFILGDPIEHVRGSAILNKRFLAAGYDIAVSPLHVHSPDLAGTIDAIRRMNNVAGFGVTIPHKIPAMKFIDELTPRAAMIGSVNFVRRNPDGTLIGDNLDGLGFIAGLIENGISVEGKAVLQFGAGGAGRAVAFAIAEAGASRLCIVNRTSAKAMDLAGAAQAAYPQCQVAAGGADPAGFDVVVNTTSSGLHEGDPLPVDPRRLDPHAAVAEIIIQPRMTPLLIAAKEQGHAVSYGQSMLDGQFELMRKFMAV